PTPPSGPNLIDLAAHGPLTLDPTSSVPGPFMASKLCKNTCGTVCGALLALALFFSLPRPLSTVLAQAPDELSYTTAQAGRGRSVYAEQCASCHGEHLD